ncbi:hypothetical protein SAMN04487820_10974 [Actinopolyspora mzabensis]|uniref:DDE superfamily endonuclease n=1 Tax=Actinopolyspora mzabensis TaxID=995066 RepID=A0A1G9CSZ4_ACTMZ|nr:transposase [Actinopolyspora mzabensis]SDK54803.1 hypothetical protein SAMN04487820_10974 [Actinopolyspora mzabensis]
MRFVWAPMMIGAMVTTEQIHDIVSRLLTTGKQQLEDPDMLVIVDAGYDLARLALLLADLPVGLLGRLRSDLSPSPARTTAPAPYERPSTETWRPFPLRRSDQLAPARHHDHNQTLRYGCVRACSWDRMHPRRTHRSARLAH